MIKLTVNVPDGTTEASVQSALMYVSNLKMRRRNARQRSKAKKVALARLVRVNTEAYESFLAEELEKARKEED